MSDSRIPFSKPFITGQEIAYLDELVASGELAADGSYAQRCQQLLRAMTGSPNVLLTPSCSSALEIAAALLNIEPGDEVIVPSFTFVTTVSSFARFGAKPVFVDIRPDTCNIDERLIEPAITKRTRAIVVVHYAGVMANMEVIKAIAKQHRLLLIEDAAQALCSRFRGAPAGSFGEIATLSFHDTKNFVCGEGGALCVNDPQLVGRAEIIRDKGTNRREFMLGQVDKYSWVDFGSSYVQGELSSAFLLAQLEAAEEITKRRRNTYHRYVRGLASVQGKGALTLPMIPGDCESNYHLFHVLLSEPGRRAEMLRYLNERGIGATFHYVPLHTSTQGKRLGGGAYDLPVTDRVNRAIVRLPLYPGLTESEQDRVINAVHDYFAQS